MVLSSVCSRQGVRAMITSSIFCYASASNLWAIKVFISSTVFESFVLFTLVLVFGLKEN